MVSLFQLKGSKDRLGSRTVLKTTRCGCIGLVALALSVQADDFTYTTNDGSITITGYTGPSNDVTIPDTISGLPVTTIGSWAFYGRSYLTNVTIPATVTSIGTSAFRYCRSLPRITIPNSVASIGGWAFAECSSLTDVVVPNSLTSIASYLFAWCSSLTNVLIPSSVTSIGSCAFMYCGSLASATIPNSVASIESSAFMYCSNLAGVTIPTSVTSIGSQAFGSCISLAAITVEAPNSAYSSLDGILFNANQTTLIQYPASRAGGDYIVPNTVTSIGGYAFNYSKSLTNVVIPNSVISIGIYAFARCTSLTAITVAAPNSAYSSLDGVLFNKSQTTLIQCPGGKVGTYTVPSSVTTIGTSAFERCSSLANVVIPSSITNIGDNAFRYCTTLTSATIPNSVPKIGGYAFAFCSTLTNVTIGTSVTSIGDLAFYYCTNLTGVYFRGNTPNVIISSAFNNANQAIVYYLPGSTGWGLTFGGRPVVLWQPQVQSSGLTFGVQTNQFGFNIAWASGMVTVVEACTNLDSPIWFPLQTNTLAGDSFYFSDPEWTNFPHRFYRIRWP